MVIVCSQWSIRAMKKGGGFIHYKETLALKMISIPYLNKGLLCEVTIGSSKCIIGTVHRSPWQNSNEFESFLSNFEFLLQDISSHNLYLTLLVGDYNARNTKWWHHDITTTEGTQLETTTTIYGLQQLIDEPIHIRKNSSSCIDLIFTNQPNLIVNRGTHPSLHENCQHQITFAKDRLRVEYPPPYKSHVWTYAKAGFNGISTPISQFDWQASLTNVPINEQVNLLNSTLMYIFSNFLPNKIAKFNDQNRSRFCVKIKAKINSKAGCTRNTLKIVHQRCSFIIYCRIWQVKFLLISQNAKMITLYVLQKSLVIVLDP